MPAKAANNKSIRDFFRPYSSQRWQPSPVEDANKVENATIPTGHSSPPEPDLRAADAQRDESPPLDPSDATARATPAPPVISSSYEHTDRAQLDGSANIDDGRRRSPAPGEKGSPKALQAPLPKLPIRASPSKVRGADLQASRDATAQQQSSIPFSSFSSLSSLPLSSQSSSKRVIKGGALRAVTNSDSGGGDSTDSDDLPDLPELVPRKRRRLTPPEPEDRSRDETETVKPLFKTRQAPAHSKGLNANAPPSPPRAKPRRSLADMVKQHEKQKQRDIDFREREVRFEEAQRQRDEISAQSKGRDVNDELVQSMVNEGEAGERMMLAMERTEALQEDEEFVFFSSDTTIWERSSFPDAKTPQSCCARLLENEHSREQACLAGYTAEMAAQGELDERHLKWFGEELVHERRHELCEAYVQILQAFPTSFYKYADLLTTFGVQYSINYPNLSFSEPSQRGRPPSLPPGLRYFIPAATHCVTSSATRYRRNLIRELAMALIDRHVRQDVTLKAIIERGIEVLVNSFDEGDATEEIEEIVRDILSERWGLSNSIRSRIIISLPALSEHSHHLRRILALRCFYNDAGRDAPAPDDAIWAKHLIAYLQASSDFAIGESTNYALLTSMAMLLDIAIDSGFGRPSSMSPPGEEQRFNNQVDALAASVKSIASRIRDAGTSHLRRTEAKSALERVIVRLDYAVRTRPKPKKGVFGEAGDNEGQRNFLSGFLKKTAAKEPSADGDTDLFHMVRVEDFGAK